MNIDKLATLAQLSFSTEEKAAMEQDLQRILAFVNQLNELDTSNIKPLVYMNQETNQTRPDVVTQELTQAEALHNAPRHGHGYFQVAKVIENK